MWVGCFMNVYFVNPRGICHLPIAFWLPCLVSNILGDCLICTHIVDCIGQVIHKRFLTPVPVDGACVERIGRMVIFLVPIEEGPSW